MVDAAWIMAFLARDIAEPPVYCGGVPVDGSDARWRDARGLGRERVDRHRTAIVRERGSMVDAAWSISGRDIADPPVHRGAFPSMAVMPDGAMLVVWEENGSIGIARLVRWERRRTVSVRERAISITRRCASSKRPRHTRQWHE